MKRICILSVLLAMLLTGCGIKEPVATDGTTLPATAATEAAPTETTPPKLTPGWHKEGVYTYYIKSDGSRHTGWLELNGNRYYFADNGAMHTGWLALDGKEYYMKSDGSAIRGKATIGQNTYYFTSQGVKTVVVNPWNVMPTGYTANIVSVEGGHKVDAVCKDALEQMLADCRKAGYEPEICSSFRTREFQIELYNNKVKYYLNRGYEPDAARKRAGQVVAVPGTSEHELGLALDLVDDNNWSLDESQEDMPAQQWLMAHCWEYGFILRYPNGKSEQTGIIYEPWHYRYVGVDLAMELKDSGMCLEEYFASLS